MERAGCSRSRRRSTCKPTLNSGAARASEAASSLHGVFTSKLVLVRMPWRCASMIPRLIPRLAPKSSPLTIANFMVLLVPPIRAVNPPPAPNRCQRKSGAAKGSCLVEALLERSDRVASPLGRAVAASLRSGPRPVTCACRGSGASVRSECGRGDAGRPPKARSTSLRLGGGSGP